MMTRMMDGQWWFHFPITPQIMTPLCRKCDLLADRALLTSRLAKNGVTLWSWNSTQPLYWINQQNLRLILPPVGIISALSAHTPGQRKKRSSNESFLLAGRDIFNIYQLMKPYSYSRVSLRIMFEKRFCWNSIERVSFSSSPSSSTYSFIIS